MTAVATRPDMPALDADDLAALRAERERVAQEHAWAAVADRPPVGGVADLSPYLRDRVKVDEHGCWIWQRALNDKGYGRASIGNGRWRRAHRLTYTELVGPIPEDHHLDHLCRVRACCNPAHLEPVTLAENNRRSARSLGPRAHCGNGHLMTPENTAVVRYGGRLPVRSCRTCSRLAKRRSDPPLSRRPGSLLPDAHPAADPTGEVFQP